MEGGLKLIREAVDKAKSLRELKESISRIMACLDERALERAREIFALF